ncbi:MAG: hypothetical protein JXQ72_11000 [Anaerolineae bacterium]|nr:hypothetical protein [Anaerolineae bacterium]
MPARFEITGCDAPDMLGIWETRPEPAAFGAADPAAFAVGVEPEPSALIWRIDLPADPRFAANLLGQRRNAAATLEAALPAAGRRWSAFTGSIRPGAPASFAWDQPLPTPERELALLIQAARGPGSFSPDNEWLGGWQDTIEQARTFIEQTRRALLYFAWVETLQAGMPVARTQVNWLGSVTTVWRAGAGSAQAGLHGDALALALDTRRSWIRIAALTAANAAALTGLLTGPGAILAIPAAWRFIRDILAEFRQ